MESTNLQPTISDIMYKAIANRAFPGGVVAFGTSSVPCFYRGYGTYTYEATMDVTTKSIWDMASLTKIMATVPSIMMLYERGLLDVEKPAAMYLPEFGQTAKGDITIRQLLTHTAGLREALSLLDPGLTDAAQIRKYILADKCCYAPGGPARYSDLSMILLAWVVERITGMPFQAFVQRELYGPLGMTQTHFRPVRDSDFDPLIVPTEVDSNLRRRLLWGEVHDPTAFLLGGVAGHAGLFSSAPDVCRYAQMILRGGVDPATGRRFFAESTVRLFTLPGVPDALNPRPFALGWDTAARKGLDGYTSAGKLLGERTFGHTGFTGTSLWMDPDRNLFVILLTNAVHPSAESIHSRRIREVRPAIADAVVHTMGHLVYPRETLTWHVGSQPALSRLQAEKPFASLSQFFSRSTEQKATLEPLSTGECGPSDVAPNALPTGHQEPSLPNASKVAGAKGRRHGRTGIACVDGSKGETGPQQYLETRLEHPLTGSLEVSRTDASESSSCNQKRVSLMDELELVATTLWWGYSRLHCIAAIFVFAYVA